MTRRLKLAELDYLVCELLDDEWCSVTDLQRQLGVGGSDWYRLALVCERLANDGYAEIKRKPGSSRRKFRRLGQA
jgi:hypothetical protein